MTISAAVQALACALPRPVPADPGARLALLAIRRLGAHGLDDAQTAQAFMGGFGHGFRRPLVLMRAFLGHAAGVAQRPIAIVPCCCARMTVAEATLLTVLARAEQRPGSAALLLGDLIGVRHPDGVLTSAAAAAAAFADAGLPVVSR